jgi:hypothetical protein
MTINAAGTYAYISNYGGSNVVYCQINNSNGSLSGCGTSASSLSGASGVAIGSNGYGYVSTINTSTVSYCTVNINGTFGTCNTTGSFSQPNGVSISGSYAYVSGKSSGDIYSCPINSNGAFGSCTAATGFSGPFATSLFMLSGTQYLFVTSGNNILACPLSSSIVPNASSCSTSYSGSSGARGITFFQQNIVSPSGDGHETISPSTAQVVNYGGTTSFTITPSGGYTLNSAVGGTCAVGSWNGSTYTTGAITGSCTVTFSAGLLAVTPNGDGNETISPSTPQGVSSGSTQAFTLTANSGYTLNILVGGTCPTGSWSGSTYTTGTITSSCSVDFSANASGYYSVIPSGDGNETISPNTPQTFASGGTQAFTVTANSGYTLNTLVGGTCPTGSWSGSTYTTGAITSTCSVIFTANAPGYYSVVPSGDGYETISPSTPQSIASGGTQAFTVTASTGHTLNNTVGGTCPAGSWSGSTYTTGIITSNCTVTFSASLVSYTVTPSGDGYETISPSTVQTVNYGSTQSFTVTVAAYYTLNAVGGTCPAGSWSGSTYTTGIITSNCTVTFSASLASYTVTPSGDGYETISPSTAQTVSSSGSQAFTVTPNTNYTVNSSVGGTCPAGFWNGSMYVTGAISSSCTVIFSATNSFTVTPGGDGNETISPSTPQTVAYGNTQAFTVTATSGTLNNTVAGTCPTGSWSGSTYTTGAITSSCSVIFSTNTSNVTITPSAGSNVSISPSTVQNVVYGANQSFTVTPTQGYTVSVGGTCPESSWSASTYTVGPVTSNCTVTVSASPIAYISNTASVAGASTILLCTGGGSGGAITCNSTPIITGLTSPGRAIICT